MDRSSLETRLLSRIQTYDLLTHPFYLAWSAGELTREDLQSYAAQYQHQVDALPALLKSVRDASRDALTTQALDRNLDEEEGRAGKPHANLWRVFRAALAAGPGADTSLEPETGESMQRLQRIAAEGLVEGLACLWAYERQTANVSRTKREGLVERYGVTEPAALEFFNLHENLDVLHADALLSAVARACGDDEEALEIACDSAMRSAQAQWRFLDGAERVRTQGNAQHALGAGEG